MLLLLLLLLLLLRLLPTSHFCSRLANNG